jgi:hypothetical protein
MRWKKAMLPRSLRKFCPGCAYEPGVLAPRSSDRQDVSLKCEEMVRAEPLQPGLAPFQPCWQGAEGGAPCCRWQLLPPSQEAAVRPVRVHSAVKQSPSLLCSGLGRPAAPCWLPASERRRC